MGIHVAFVCNAVSEVLNVQKVEPFDLWRMSLNAIVGHEFQNASVYLITKK
jgi:hypothetical protein